MNEQEVEKRRTVDLVRYSKIAILFIAIPLALQSILTDLQLHGSDWIWLALRAGTLPLGILSIWLFRFQLVQRLAAIPTTIVICYFALGAMYFVSETGYQESPYFHSYVQILLGVTVLPYSLKEYFCITGLVLVSYIGLLFFANDMSFAFLSAPNVIFLKTYVLLALIVFFVLNRTRKLLYRRIIDQERQTANRQIEIDEKVELLTKARFDLMERDIEAKRLTSLNELSLQVAHDIRSPLQALETATFLLDSQPDAAKKLMRSATDRVHSIADALLGRYRSNSEERLESTETNLEKLILGIIAEKKAEYSHLPEVAFEAQIDAADIELGLNPGQFQAILSNLINNSVESLPSKKGRIFVSATRRRDGVSVEVHDTGIGIPEDILKTLGREKTSTKPSGNGLGLFNARQVVEEQWNGRLGISSTLNKGTTITVDIPAKYVKSS